VDHVGGRSSPHHRSGHINEYFRRLYDKAEQDSAGIMAAESEQRFDDVARTFHTIEDTGESVIAPRGAWKDPVEEIRVRGISRLRLAARRACL
jgi:hypothetical protein